MKPNQFLQSKAFQILVSLVFALVLFFNANITSLSSGGSSSGSNTEAYSATVKDIPIEIQYDSKNFFISGYESTATVYLSSYNRVRIDSESNPDTRTFKVIADMTKNTVEGTYEIPLRFVESSVGVNGQVDPSQISVTLEKKTVKEFPVKAVVPSKLLPDGYSIGKVTLEKDTVKVTTGAETMKKIDHVEAVVPSDTMLDQDFDDAVTLQAVDAQGNVVPAEIDPKMINVDAVIHKPSKTVPVVYQFADKTNASKYTVETITPAEVKVSGALDDLAKVQNVLAHIDLGKIDSDQLNKDMVVNATVTAENVLVTPNKVSVKLKVNK
jgi:YbbR domain-containing protein